MNPNTDFVDQFIINGKIYNSKENCYGTGWSWDSKSRVLFLNTYHGTAIDCAGNLTIIISGAENRISDRHNPAICVRNGDLILQGDGSLNLDDSETGICIKTGNLQIISLNVNISAENFGIYAENGISISGSTISIHSNDTGMKTDVNSPITTNTTTLHIIADVVGIDCAGPLDFDGGIQIIEVSRGTGIYVRDGSCTIKNSFFRATCREFGLSIENGDQIIEFTTAEISASTGISVKGSLFGNKMNLFINGGDIGILVNGNVCSLLSGCCVISGNVAFSLNNNVIFSQVNVTVEGEKIGILTGGSYLQDKSCVSVLGRDEIGISVGTDMIFSGSSIDIHGNNGLVIFGNLEVLGGSITAIGEETAIEVHGTYAQKTGMISGMGMTKDGIRVAKKMIIFDGKIDATGFTTGLTALDDFTIQLGILTASGKTGLRVEGNFAGEGGYLTAFGDEFGLYVSGGNTVIGDVVIDIAGDVSVYTSNSVTIQNGAQQISGHYCGIFVDNGDVTIENGLQSISADTFGILVKSGSVFANGGTLQIRITDADSNSSGICLLAGDSILTGGRVIISGGVEGVRGDQGIVSVTNAELDVAGTDSGIVARSLQFTTGTLTAYGRKGALCLDGNSLICNEDTIIICGKSGTNAVEGPYEGQWYVHMYPKHFAQIEIPATVDSLDKIVQWVDDLLRPNGITESFISKMTLVIEELFVNIVNYAYPNEDGSVLLKIYVGPCLKLILSDTGIAFNPLKSAEPDLTVPIDDRKIGGWGIFLSRKLTDKITYERVNETNVLTIYKKLYT